VSDRTFQFFAVPEWDEDRQQLEPRTLDPNHCLTNCRAHIMTKGYDFITPKMFQQITDDDPEVVGFVNVHDVADKQNVFRAKRMFSVAAEDKLRQYGHVEAAKFTRVLREW